MFIALNIYSLFTMYFLDILEERGCYYCLYTVLKSSIFNPINFHLKSHIQQSYIITLTGRLRASDFINQTWSTTIINTISTEGFLLCPAL